ncbi:GNAT family N-acetyltransferase [Streptomyces avicenniae]|uniref:GNAT family N-acetyltransferase n=1 Tax=Streptomyces avicenniae TaxID=500153 RepID=UPI00069BF189|nr:GNAT family N-acetyltransferase [Streptomyces avicenniae]
MPTTITHYLEMTAPGDLSPAPAVPGLALRLIDGARPEAHAAQKAVGAPYGWRAVSLTEADWAAQLREHPSRQYWLITHDGGTAGVAFLEPAPGGDVEIEAFGLLPAYVGRGLGGYALTLALRQAWATEPVDGVPVRRVWLHTCSNDHPRALGNYEKRGLRRYRVEEKAEDVGAP